METKWARQCDKCQCGMNEGYVLYGGQEYYCSKDCLNTKYSDEEWESIYYEGDDSCYTNWYDEVN